MKRRLLLVCLVAFSVCFLWVNVTKAVTKEDFLVKNTKSLLNLCNAKPDDPLFVPAIHFCEGYLVGAFHYYVAANRGPEGKKLVCFPDPPPTRDQTVKMFIEWANAHPEYNNELPVETEFRFLMQKWPCRKK